MDMHGWIMDAAWDLGWMGSMKMQACCFSGPSADPMIETGRIVGAVASWNVGPAETLAACGNLSHRIQEHEDVPSFSHGAGKELGPVYSHPVNAKTQKRKILRKNLANLKY